MGPDEVRRLLELRQRLELLGDESDEEPGAHAYYRALTLLEEALDDIGVADARPWPWLEGSVLRGVPRG